VGPFRGGDKRRFGPFARDEFPNDWFSLHRFNGRTDHLLIPAIVITRTAHRDHLGWV
jgi:hypothetical protein